jgi:hypothetical protein
MLKFEFGEFGVKKNLNLAVINFEFGAQITRILFMSAIESVSEAG